MKHLLDLRDELEREAEPLALYFEGVPITALELQVLEDGSHGLDPAQAYLVVCEFGQKSKLAVLYLQSDGIQAEQLEGGILTLRKQAEQEWTLPYSDHAFRALLEHPRVRFVARQEGLLKVRGTLTPQDLRVFQS